nr:flagellar biosynthetic protein FliO [uncultured Nocardioides sp.]
MLELTVRLIASLAVVVGLMLLLARLVGKRYGTRAGSPVQVLHRQALSRSASVAVITVAGRVLVVGSTDHQVSLLTELDAGELGDLGEPASEDESSPEPATLPTLLSAVLPGAQPAVVPDPATDPDPADLPRPTSVVTRGGSHRATPAPRRTSPDGGALAGSVLSPQTWREALAAATGKAS